MTPIEKNIRVIDESGNKYEATFNKRAIGLVKKGRARFVDDTTICLDKTSFQTRSAGNEKPENKKMDNNAIDNINTKRQTDSDFIRDKINRMMTILESKNPDGEPYMMVNHDMFNQIQSMLLTLIQTSNDYEETPDEPSIKYILSRIDMIIREKEHIENALTTIQTMQLNESPNGGFGDQARAEAIQSTVQSRETTNQKILDMLDKMYDDLKPRQDDYRENILQKIIDAADGAGPFTEEKISLIEKFNEILDSLRHLNN
ncbi:MAG: hypothetical protein ACYCWE_13285 [Eubacteriales bacterium]